MKKLKLPEPILSKEEAQRLIKYLEKSLEKKNVKN